MMQLKAIQGHLGLTKSRYEEHKLFPSLQQKREEKISLPQVHLMELQGSPSAERDFQLLNE